MPDSKPISLEEFRKKREQEEAERSVPGKMVWLHCPKCKTLEYTEIISPAGRTHKCGALVEEREVDLDLRAELTITELNLATIATLLKKNSGKKLVKIITKSFDNALTALKLSEETYRERLMLAAGIKITPYPGRLEEIMGKLPVRTTNRLGLLISEFRFEPERRFNLKQEKK